MNQDRADRWQLPRNSRLFVVGDPLLPGSPDWMDASVATFVEHVSNRAYPCHFGRQSLGVGDVLGTWLTPGDGAATLAASLASFLATAASAPQRRAVLACFVAPDLSGPDHLENEKIFWNLVRGLHAVDPVPWPTQMPADPDEAAWEFCFGGQSMFVFAAVPTHHRRLSRRFGDGMILLFQPRHVFRGIEGGTPAGDAARTMIRQRLAAWDLAPLHPAMGNYGDADNREWMQYFIEDVDPMVEAVGCPIAPDGTWRGVIGWIEDQAQRTPEEVAIVDHDAVVTYADMLDRVAVLGTRIADAGAGRGIRTGVMVDRSLDSVIAVLACLWAGSAYVPVDPGAPLARRTQLLEEAGAGIVVVASDHLGAVPAFVETVVLTDEPSGPPPTRLRDEVLADDLAYVIYTSGSTGVPRGVAVTHGQLANAVFAQHAVERPRPEAFLLPISLCFDAAGAAVYWTLTSGGILIIPDDDQVRDVAELRRLTALYEVTHTDSTPSLYSRILGEDAAGLDSLRCVQVGGEPCPSELLARHRRLLPSCYFENNYGPTEASIWATTHLVPPQDPEAYDEAVLTIGDPVRGVGVLLLDDELDPVPDGTDGELYITGDGVALGYLGRAGATAERFLPDPSEGRSGRRMYRSGDRARRDDRGRLHFLGRRDSQVKLRGFRVELGEIEQALHTHPDVDEACAVVVEVGGADTLVGLVRSHEGQASDASLAAHLMQRLPGHAVPRRYVQVDDFPRLVSGKVDRRRLATLALRVPATAVPAVPEASL